MEKRLTDHIAHYRADAETFDYFNVENAAIREEERRRIQILSHTMKFKKGERLLDAGSGGGWVSQTYLHRGVFVCCLDISSRNLLEIRRRYDPERTGGYVVADLYNLPFKKEAFDGATSNDVFEHLEDLDGAASELRGTMKAGGRVFVSVPYRENIVYYLCIHCNKKTPVNAHLHSFDETNLGRVFTGNGFRIDSVAKFINKGMSILLIYYHLCRWMPYWLWRSVDVIANAIVRKPGRMGMKLVAVDSGSA
jgi:SAM-dependent methyltransferase